MFSTKLNYLLGVFDEKEITTIKDQFNSVLNISLQMLTVLSLRLCIVTDFTNV
jgi:hypothetical protein